MKQFGILFILLFLCTNIKTYACFDDEDDYLYGGTIPNIDVYPNHHDDNNDDEDNWDDDDEDNWDDDDYPYIGWSWEEINDNNYCEGNYDNNIQDIYNNLNDAEKKLAMEHPLEAIQVALNAKAAEDLADHYFKDNGVHNGLNDACRHMIWSAYNCLDIGYELAKEFGDAHEMDPKQSLEEKEMDEYNNNLGYNIGLYARSYLGKGDIPGLVLDNIGNAKTLK